MVFNDFCHDAGKMFIVHKRNGRKKLGKKYDEKKTRVSYRVYSRSNLLVCGSNRKTAGLL